MTAMALAGCMRRLSCECVCVCMGEREYLWSPTVLAGRPGPL